VARRFLRGAVRVAPLRERLAEAADGQERVVDAEPEADHRREALDENRERHALRDPGGDAQRERDREQADADRQRRGHDAAEGEEQQEQGEGKHVHLGGAGVGRARAPQVVVERGDSGPAEPRVGVDRAELRDQRRGGRAQRGEKALDGLAARIEAHDDQEPAVLAAEERVVLVERRDHAGDARHLFDGSDDRLEDLLAAGLAERRHPLADEDHAVGERRAEAQREVVLDRLRLAARHAGGDLEPLLQPARVGHEDGGGDHPDRDDRPAPAHDPGRPTGEPRLKRAPGAGIHRVFRDSPLLHSRQIMARTREAAPSSSSA
jgi:hypothetical protein